MHTEPVLGVEGLRIGFSGRGVVVDGVSFTIARGESLVLLGESGSGKSTIALSIMRLLPEPAGRVLAGRVSFCGTDLLRLEERRMCRVRGCRIGMIFQEPQSALNPVLTIGQQLEECLPGLNARARAVALLDAVGLSDAVRAHRSYAHQLSGGMRQRAIIAMAIASEPDLLIADEPTSALDVTIQAQILDLIKSEQKRRDMALLLVTHDLGVAYRMADEVAVLCDGVIVEQAVRDSLFRHPRHPYTQDLFEALPSWERRGAPLVVPDRDRYERSDGCRYARRCRLVHDRCQLEDPDWRGAAESRVRCHLDPLVVPSPVLPARGAEPAARGDMDLLQIQGLTIEFTVAESLFRTRAPIRAVDGVSLRVGHGRTLALVGESGSGKTTLGKAIIRLLPVSGGRILFNGKDLSTLRGRDLRRQRRAVQMIFQDPYASLDPRMTAAAIIEEGLAAQRLLPAGALRRARVRKLLGEVGLPQSAEDRYPHEFSGGQRQRIAIARALAVEPQLMICDEPTSALDVSVQAQILNLLSRLQRDLGLSYLFITHNLGVVEYLAHDIAILYAGKIVEQGTAIEVLKMPRHPYTVSLLAAVLRIDEPASARDGEKTEVYLGVAILGCPFHPRCRQALPVCRTDMPAVRRFSGTHEAACHLWSERDALPNGLLKP